MTRIVADTHAIVWFGENSGRLSTVALNALTKAEADEGVLVSAASVIDLWYVMQTTRALGPAHLTSLEAALADETIGIVLSPVDARVVRAFQSIAISVLPDPWDRIIVATAIAHGLSLVTRDERITRSDLVQTVWWMSVTGRTAN